jgi:hypothetical protein
VPSGRALGDAELLGRAALLHRRILSGDKIRPGSGGVRVIALGKNRGGPAFMVCRDTPGGGFVFNVSSIAFTPCLDDDAFIQELVRNLIRRGMTLR